MGRSVTGAGLPVLIIASALALQPGMASGTPCDGPSCVPNMRVGAVEGASCVPRRLAPFGLDASGNTLICMARYGVQTSASWSRVPQIVDVRDYGTLCGEAKA
jgi:hypothetical protein